MNNSTLQQRKDRAFARGQGTLVPVYIEKAVNSELWEIKGKRYIDLGSGITVVNHPKVQAASQSECQSLWFFYSAGK